MAIPLVGNGQGSRQRFVNTIMQVSGLNDNREGARVDVECKV